MNTPYYTPRPARTVQGSSMLEILIAVLVLAIGLLGVAALQARALKNNQSALERSQAVALAYFIFDAMRANIDEAQTGAYNLPRTCTLLNNGNLVANDQRLWLHAIKDTLGNNSRSCGEISCLGPTCTIRIYWDDSRGTDGNSNQFIEITSRL